MTLTFLQRWVIWKKSMIKTTVLYVTIHGDANTQTLTWIRREMKVHVTVCLQIHVHVALWDRHTCTCTNVLYIVSVLTKRIDTQMCYSTVHTQTCTVHVHVDWKYCIQYTTCTCTCTCIHAVHVQYKMISIIHYMCTCTRTIVAAGPYG